MTFPDITPALRAAVPALRGRLQANAPLAEITWFRTGGPAQALFVPADEDDLAEALARFPPDLPVQVLGLASNTLVRDGGIPGLTVRLGRGFGSLAVEGDQVRAGAAVPDMQLARAAAEAGLAGLAFFRGIPGAIGGALRVNAGAYGGETKDVLVEARALDRGGRRRVLPLAAMAFAYRQCGAPEDLVFTQALLRGRPGDRAAIAAEMASITRSREATQPVKSRTGGSTFKNPPGQKAWRLIDAAGCRGLRMGDAQVSEMHCNFLINHGQATAADIEALGEEVRRHVRESSGVDLAWEIMRVGTRSPPEQAMPQSGHPAAS